MANTATRLITLIMLLQTRPNQKAADLAQELGVSVRTLHRYMGMLDEMGIPIYSERGPLGGFSLVRGYKMPPLVFTPQEAVAVYLGLSQVQETWGRLYQDAAQAALAKLQNVMPNEQQSEIAWARRTLIATGMHRTRLVALTPVLEEIRGAIHECKAIKITYRDRTRGQPVPREVDPYALVHGWGRWYVIAYCHLRRAMRTFRVDRIESCTRLDRTFQLPTDFDVRDYMKNETPPQGTILVRLHLSPELAPMARDEAMMWQEVQWQPDGSAIVTFPATEIEYAVSMAISLAPLAEILEPPELRDLVRERARAILAHFEKETS